MTEHLEIVKHLITECGCDPMCGDQEGRTPLHNACLMGQLEAVKYLVACKCDPMLVDNHGNTSLRFACDNGQLTLAKYLVNEYKCSPEYGNMNGFTPLPSAAS